MNNQRYIRLQEITYDTFILGAPVEIEKGALLLDTHTKTVILQLKLNVLVDPFKQISSVKVKIQGYDDAGDLIDGFSPYTYTFRDINLIENKSFGDKTPIILDPRIRKTLVDIERIVFVNGEIWENKAKDLVTPKQILVSELGSVLLEQLNRDVKSLPTVFRDRIKFFPQQENNCWLCTCGRPNTNKEKSCCRCGLDKNHIFQLLHGERIRDNLRAYSESCRMKKELAQQKKEKRAHRKKQIFIVSISIIMIAISTAILIHFVSLSSKYNQALNNLENNEFDKAIMEFEALGDYKDSRDWMLEAKYQKGGDLLANIQYDEAIIVFENIKGYKNSEDLINESLYQKATDLYSGGQIEEALVIFEYIKNYRNSQSFIDDIHEELILRIYNVANDLFYGGIFNEALEIFLQISGYRDTDDYVKKILLINELRSNFYWDGGKYYILINSVIIKQYKGNNEFVVEDIFPFNPKFDNNLETITFSFDEEEYFFDGQNLFNNSTNRRLRKPRKIDVESLN